MRNEQEQSIEELQEALARKSRFLACMSHDLRSPLHAIIGISDIMLSEDEIQGRNRSLMRYVKSAGNTLMELVDSILIFSKLEAGKLELADKPYDLELILEDLTNMCIINLQNKPVHFSVTMSGDHPSEFMGDALRVRQMLQNLLSNAVKFTEEGEIRCKVTCEEHSEGYLLTATVVDTGPGMSKEQLAHTFEEYSSYTDAAAKEGTGLGLSIVRRLAEMMGGTASASSDGKNGSLVRFTIYQKAAEGAAYRPSVVYSENTMLRHRVQGAEGIAPRWSYPDARVLLADDMRVNQEVFKGLLRPWHLGVDTVSTGQEAIEAARSREYQLIFLDMRLTDMMGSEVAMAIRGVQDAPIVLMTADVSDHIEETYASLGFDAFLPKPVSSARLRDLIEELIPARFRHAFQAGLNIRQIEDGGYDGSSKGYRRMLEAFAAEAEPMIAHLKTYATGNHDMFETVMHGIKGAGLQIGRHALSESAEVMEMAAKTDNFSFIERHLNQFIAELDNAVQEVRVELARMSVTNDTVTPMQETQPSEVLFARLKEGFENYDMSAIEDNLHALEASALSPENTALLAKVRNAYEDLEYELGAVLLRGF